MTLKHLPTMLSLSSIKWKRHKSSRFLPEFNSTTNQLIRSMSKRKAAVEKAATMENRLPPLKRNGGGR